MKTVNPENEANAVDVRFIRVPSIAERKLGPDHAGPMRLDPRMLDNMQQTIRGLEGKYGETLLRQIDGLFRLLDDIAAGSQSACDRLYDIAHDMRGLAGTFGHPMISRFANSLCTYIEGTVSSERLDGTILRFHIEAMQDTLSGRENNDIIALETLRALERLIKTTIRERRIAG
ncbi:MAG: hypothetical protein GC184_05075 [Rhizobiales bacterium]|nr:hypothetical protein [Hyphomicrobiales bacterium]